MSNNIANFYFIESQIDQVITEQKADRQLIQILLHFLKQITVDIYIENRNSHLAEKGKDLYSKLFQYDVTLNQHEQLEPSFEEINANSRSLNIKDRVTIYRMQQLGMLGGEPIVLNEDEIAQLNRYKNNEISISGEPQWNGDIVNIKTLQIKNREIADRMRRIKGNYDSPKTEVKDGR